MTKHQPLIEIETDKVTVELEAPADGTLAEVTASPGDDVAVGTVIALILAPGEALSRTAEPLPGRAPASPVARRMARDLGIDLAALARRLGRPVQASDVQTAVHLILATLSSCLARGDRIELRGFGSFWVAVRAPRRGPCVASYGGRRGNGGRRRSRAR